MVATSYQSVSGSGHKGIATLQAEETNTSPPTPTPCGPGAGSLPPPGFYPRPIGWNVIPFAGGGVDGGYTDEEMKLVTETRKILDAPGRGGGADLRAGAGDGRATGSAATAWFDRPRDGREAWMP